VPEYAVVFARSARKELQALDPSIAARILKRVEAQG
jgi:mRNA-degrading endonuclease RelE of RelBE toxin-antitoxin system